MCSISPKNLQPFLHIKWLQWGVPTNLNSQTSAFIPLQTSVGKCNVFQKLTTYRKMVQVLVYCVEKCCTLILNYQGG